MIWWLLMACGPEPGTPLIDGLAWSREGAVDPYPEHAPDTLECPGDGWEEELGGIEIETDACNYAVLAQPLLIDVPANTPVEVLAWHNDLAAVDPGEAHLALFVGDYAVLDEAIPIPSDAGVYTLDVTFPERVPAGAPVVLHVHNHGANTYNINALRIGE